MINRYFAKIKQFSLCLWEFIEVELKYVVDRKTRVVFFMWMEKVWTAKLSEDICKPISTPLFSSLAFSDLTSLDEKLSDWNDDLPGHQRQPWREGGGRGGDDEHANGDKEKIKEFLRV